MKASRRSSLNRKPDSTLAVTKPCPKDGVHLSEPDLPPHTRLALSVIERAVKDIEYDDESLHRSAARFLNGSEDFYFWARSLEQDSGRLLRALRLRLRKDSPRAYKRLLTGDQRRAE